MAYMTSENYHFIFSDILMTELLFTLSFFNSPFWLLKLNWYNLWSLSPHLAVSLPTLFLLLRMPFSVLYAYLNSVLLTSVYEAVISLFFPYQSTFPVALLNSTSNAMPYGAVNWCPSPTGWGAPADRWPCLRHFGILYLASSSGWTE